MRASASQNADGSSSASRCMRRRRGCTVSMAATVPPAAASVAGAGSRPASRAPAQLDGGVERGAVVLLDRRDHAQRDGAGRAGQVEQRLGLAHRGDRRRAAGGGARAEQAGARRVDDVEGRQHQRDQVRVVLVVAAAPAARGCAARRRRGTAGAPARPARSGAAASPRGRPRAVKTTATGAAASAKRPGVRCCSMAKARLAARRAVSATSASAAAVSPGAGSLPSTPGSLEGTRRSGRGHEYRVTMRR